MYRKNVSGQFLFFSLASVASGLPITSGGTAVSGRRSIDGAAQSLISGTITEIGGGQYVCNLFDFDTNGNNIGFLFTASGAGMVNYTMLTLGGVSGGIYLASGSVTSGVIVSGIYVNAATTVASGIFVTASLNSGQSVLVYSGQLSGQFVTPQSGTTFLASGSVTSGVICSGVFVTVPIASISGVQPISGTTVTVPIASISGNISNSGLFVTVPIATISGVQPISGTTVFVPIASISGVQPISGTSVITTVYSGQLSGQFVTPQSGNVWLATDGVTSGKVWIASGIPQSGQVWIASGCVRSGEIWPFSGLYAFLSGNLYLASGNPYSGKVWLASGSIASGLYIASGQYVTVPIDTISGAIANSGLFVTVPIASISGAIANSGLFVTVPIATLSGVQPISGTFVNASLNSGQNVLTYSGTIQLASGEATYRIPYNVLSFDFTNLSGLIMSGTSGRNLVNANRKLTNKWSLTDQSGYLRIYQEDDTQIAYDQAFTSVSGGQPLSSLDTK